MLKKISLLLLLSAMPLLSAAQKNAKAKALLDEVYEKVNTYENIQIDFKYALENTEADTKSETNGKATLEGDKYVVDLFGSQQLFDGAKVYTIVPDNEEVTIEDRVEGENTVTPSKMLTFYREGHNYEWDILQNAQGRKIQYVKLIPIDTDSEIKSILLGVDAETKHIAKLIETGKNGTKTTITVNSFKTNQPLSKSLFTFDEAKYKNDGYYIIRN
ncbi:MAG: outer membrane lipoprotein carrier protein LolA [Croceitalea sp.]|nr:outer membrane lipoprotein carrier protein LolA [Croceitalea sp.]MBT8239273.1 outer membrane lipoprotein carrier protein LolA [Croceitalea sp.]NNC33286.1 outer membrane lipoprotein carrier protein LolA [Croceitalea sp.]NNL09783.1 outer membrane lipoprotein carrier protein LolA [Croceitalea sp.]NNM17049.1 outer membrane lipoprotein carrier protein LolA [Croceitalea sp.]